MCSWITRWCCSSHTITWCQVSGVRCQVSGPGTSSCLGWWRARGGERASLQGSEKADRWSSSESAPNRSQNRLLRRRGGRGQAPEAQGQGRGQVGRKDVQVGLAQRVDHRGLPPVQQVPRQLEHLARWQVEVEVSQTPCLVAGVRWRCLVEAGLHNFLSFPKQGI